MILSLNNCNNRIGKMLHNICIAAMPIYSGERAVTHGPLVFFIQQLEEMIETLKPYGLVKGVRHILDFEKEDWITREDVNRGLSVLERHGLTYDLLVRCVSSSCSFIEMFYSWRSLSQVQRTFWNTSRYPYHDISDVQNWGWNKLKNHI